MSIEVLSVTDLLQKEFPPSELILGGELLDKSGAMLITGPQKIGKSLFAGQLGLSIADRKPVLDFSPGDAEYRVLILQAEVSERRMQQRFRKQSQAFSEDGRHRVLSACVFSSVKLDRPASQQDLKALVEEHQPDVLVIDPLVNFHTGDENDASDMARATSALDTLRGMGTAVAVVHHHGKGSRNQSNVGHKARGSSALAGWYDSHLSLEWADRQARTAKLRFELRNGETPEDMIVRLNPETLLFEVRSDEASQISLVVSTIQEIGEAGAQAVADRCGNTRQWASRWLNQAVEQDRLVRRGDRPVLFNLPPAPNEVRVNVSAPPGVLVTTNTNSDGNWEEEGPYHVFR